MSVLDQRPGALGGARWIALYTPKLVTALREGYGLADLRADALAGLTVAVVALPLAMGIAIASGAPPSTGLWTAVTAGFLISALGGSRHQVGGPTAAFAVVVFGVVAEHGLDGLALATLMAGAMLILAGLLRAGLWMKYVPEPVITGFTVGIAITIVSTQAGALVGIDLADPEGEVIPRWIAYFHAWETADVATAAIGLGAIAAILAMRRWAPRAPGFLVAVAFAALIAAVLAAPVDTIGSVYGAGAAAPPVPHLPAVSGERLATLFPSAFTIAFLAGVESLLSATVADGMTGRRHRSNCELVAQGVANMASGALGGLPATGAIARTATNIRAGARTPVAGLLHAAFLLAFILVAGRLIALIPVAALAAILVVVAFNMAEPRRVARLITRAPWPDRLVFLTTASLTVLVDLTVAVQVGVVLSAILVMRQMARTVEVTSGGEVTLWDEPDRPQNDVRDRLPPDVEAYKIRGPFFYAAAERLQSALDRIAKPPRVFILRMSEVAFVDATGAEALIAMTRRFSAQGASVILAGAPRDVLRTLIAMGLREAEHVRAVHDTDEAIALARAIVEGETPP